MAGRRRGPPPTTMEVIPAPRDESVRMNSGWTQQADGESSELEESVSSVYTDDFEDSDGDEFVEEELDEEIEQNSEEGRRMLQNTKEDASISSYTVADCGEEDEGEEEPQEGVEEAEAKEEVVLHHYRDQDLGKGIVLKVPLGASDINCHVEPLCAEERTEMLDELVLSDGHMMVSDLYRVVGDGFPPVNNTPYRIQLPLHLPSTKLDKRDLLKFMAFTKWDIWTSHESDYEDGLVSFPVENLYYFVMYAEQRAEVINITPRGYTFVSSKDQRIRVEVPEGAVDTKMIIFMQIQPTSMGRLEWYRAYDPEVLEGIYALSDILTVRYAVDRALSKPTIVELPIEDTESEGTEVKWLNAENGVYSVSASDHGIKNGTVRTSHSTTGKSSCQATIVRPGVSDERIIRCAMLQRNELNKCKILIFLSRTTGFQCRCMTVEVVESPHASSRVRTRRKRGFYEVKQSRSPDIDVLRDERIRVSFSGNIQQVDKREMKNLIFQFSATSEENYVETRIKRVGFMTGVPYGIVTIKIGSDKSHEVHFYVDYPLDSTTNLNKQTQNKESDYISLNSQIRNRQSGLNIRADSSTVNVQTDSAGVGTRCDRHRCDIADQVDAAITVRHFSTTTIGNTAATVINPCHSGVSAEQRDSLYSVSVTPGPSHEGRGRVAKCCGSLRVLSDSTSGVFTDVTTSSISNNRGDASAGGVGCGRRSALSDSKSGIFTENETTPSMPNIRGDAIAGDVGSDRGRVLSDSTSVVFSEEATTSSMSNSRGDASAGGVGCGRRRALSDSTSGVFTENETTPSMSNNRGDASARTSPSRYGKHHSYVPKGCERGRALKSSRSRVFTEEVTIPLMPNNRADVNHQKGPVASSSDVHTPWKQKTYKDKLTKSLPTANAPAEGAPASGLPDIRTAGPSSKEHPVMQRVTPRRQTDLRKGNASQRQQMTQDLGNNVPGEASDKILQRSTENMDFSNRKRNTTLVSTVPSRDTKHNRGIKSGHKKSGSRLPPLSEPRKPSKISSSVTHANPLLSESSLQGLSHALATPEWQQVMVDLGIGADNITVIVERAVRENWDPRFKLLLAWRQKHSGKPNLMSDMEESMRRIDRSDIADTIRQVRQEGRSFRKDDFTPY